MFLCDVALGKAYVRDWKRITDGNPPVKGYDSFIAPGTEVSIRIAINCLDKE